MNVKAIRRENLRSLAKTIGGITALSQRLNKSQSQISHLIGANPIKNIGDRLASDIERLFEKPPGWLDKEHFRVTENGGVYAVSDQTSPRVLKWVPLVQWQDFQQGQLDTTSLARACQLIPVNFDVSADAFALPVLNDVMDAPIGISFPKNSLIIVDPWHIATDSSYVVALTATHPTIPIFRQFLHQGGKTLLKPLNPRYEEDGYDDPRKILGVVRQGLMRLE